jgi:hypothetical protein
MIDFLGRQRSILETISRNRWHCSCCLRSHDAQEVIHLHAAKDLGLPLLNPYLDKSADFTYGVNFAVAGATALNTAALAKKGVTIALTNSSLDVQLKWFKDFMASTTSSAQGNGIYSSPMHPHRIISYSASQH